MASTFAARPLPSSLLALRLLQVLGLPRLVAVVLLLLQLLPPPLQAPGTGGNSAPGRDHQRRPLQVLVVSKGGFCAVSESVAPALELTSLAPALSHTSFNSMTRFLTRLPLKLSIAWRAPSGDRNVAVALVPLLFITRSSKLATSSSARHNSLTTKPLTPEMSTVLKASGPVLATRRPKGNHVQPLT